MRILLIGHPLIVDQNRKVWAVLAGSDHQIDVVIPDKWPNSLNDKTQFKENTEIDTAFNSIKIISTYFSGNGSLFFFSPLKLFRHLRNNKYDRIIITQETWSVCLLVFRILNTFTSNRSVPVYLWVCQNILKKNLLFTWWIEKIITFQIKQVWGCCNETLDVIRQKGIKSPWRRLPFSVDKIHISYNQTNSEKVRVGFIGRLTKEKGVPFMINSLKELSNDIATIRVAGAGELKNYIESITDVSYLGVIPHSDVSKFYKSIDVLIVPSETSPFWKEQFGRVIIESVSYGIPVISSDSGAIPEVMNSIEMKYIFQEKNSDSLKEQFKKFLEDRRNNKLGAMMKISQDLVREQYSHSEIVEKIQGYLNE